MNINDGLRQVRLLLADPRAWTKSAIARDDDDAVVRTRSPAARCWCIGGGIQVVFGPRADYSEILAVLEKSLPPEWEGYSITAFNDYRETTHADIIALLDRAIERVPA